MPPSRYKNKSLVFNTLSMKINDFFLRTKATEYDSLKMKQYSKPKIYHGGSTELSKKSTIEEIRTRFLLAIDDTRLNGSQIGRRIRELGSQKIYNLKNGRNGVTLENLISFSKEFPQYNIKWIMYGEEEMLVKEKKRSLKVNLKKG